MTLPQFLDDDAMLADWLTRPTPALTQFVASLEGPLMVLGAGGKMGPSLCVQAKRAAEKAGVSLEVIAVSRFSNPVVKSYLEANDVNVVPFDLTGDLNQLPDAPNIIYLVGLKFGTSHDPTTMWHCHTVLPARVSERFDQARIVALSTGNVYAFTTPESGGARERDVLHPVGEYAQSCLARERVFAYYAKERAIPVACIRLNYAVEMRYGVLVDLAKKIKASAPIDLAMGYFNCIWQADANAAIIHSLALAETPAAAYNLTGLEIFSVETVATQLADQMGKTATFKGSPNPTALLSNASELQARLGIEETAAIDDLIRWTAHWVDRGGATLNKPTRFEVRDGKF